MLIPVYIIQIQGVEIGKSFNVCPCKTDSKVGVGGWKCKCLSL